ncbi:hypothetical protein AVEN_178162-1 [Araneus ventricosus]|uniref:Uncharacterized protein n=1 Tax=Araneus ventricosus TaxID=182803 RepID=A0A4Y1ZWY0_ARAVE|nr:hypothetical protein AVEN_178162-1 [Araneus ventricosus]
MDDNALPYRARLVRSHLKSDSTDSLSCYITGPESHRTCVGHVGKTDCRSQWTPRAPTILTTGMGITATTSDQRHYFQPASPLSSMHFS